MTFVTPPPEGFSLRRPAPLLWAQETAVPPDVAAPRACATGMCACRVYWCPLHDDLYALECADLDRSCPLAVMVYSHWGHYEPHLLEHDIAAGLLELCRCGAEIPDRLDPCAALRAAMHTELPEGHDGGRPSYARAASFSFPLSLREGAGVRARQSRGRALTVITCYTLF